MKKFAGVDIGGMTIKGIIIDGEGTVLCEDIIETGWQKGGDNICANVETLISGMLKSGGLSLNDVDGIGVCCPGLIDNTSGTVLFAGNLNLENYPLKEKLERLFGRHVKVANDANSAALGEARFGAGKNYSDSILLTLGTGVGGGIVIGGKLFEGYKGAGTELGHTVIEQNGNFCTCGRRGCLEAYASATALIKKTKEAMSENPDSEMWKGYSLDTVNGRTAFDYPDDFAASRVTEWYIRNLACGIINFVNVFRPQVVMLGGGISKQGERLTAPIQKILDAEIFGGQSFAPVKVVTASLGSRAGAFGAASLCF